MPLPFGVRYPRRPRGRPGLIPGFSSGPGFAALLILALVGGLLVFGRGERGLTWATELRVVTVKASSALVSAWDRAGGSLRSVFRAPRLNDENALLRAKLDEALLLAEENRRVETENTRLRKLLGYAASVPGHSLPARVVAVDPGEGGWYRSVWVDRGSIQGVRLRDPVRVPEGLVGRIIQVEPERSQVLVLTDPDFRAAAILETTRVRGELRGRGGRELDFVVLSSEISVPVPTPGPTPPSAAPLPVPDLGEIPYSPGERVVTSGLGGVFPDGLVLGRVTGRREDPQGISPILTLLSEVNPAGLEYVFIVLSEPGS